MNDGKCTTPVYASNRELPTSKILNFLQNASDERILSPPIRPKENEVYLFSSGGDKSKEGGMRTYEY